MESISKNKYDIPILIKEFELIAQHPHQINFFGKFQLLDDNYTKLLSPKLKQIFIFLYYKTIEEGSVHTHEFSKVIWPDYSIKNVSNARNTGVKKLRDIFKDTDAINIALDGKDWSVQTSDEVAIDYQGFRMISKVISQSLENNYAEPGLVSEYLRYLEKGAFLQEFEWEWLDDIKSKVYEEIVNTLLLLLNSPTSINENELKLRICNAIFTFDELNAAAFQIKVKILSSTSKHGLAYRYYNAFIKKYKSICGIDYPGSFASIVDK